MLAVSVKPLITNGKRVLQMSGDSKSSSATKTVGFRLDDTTERRIRAVAAAQGQHLSDLLRELVHERLEQSETLNAACEELSSDVEQLASELRELRADLATSVEAILALMGRDPKLTPAQAKKWVDHKLRHKL